MSPHSSSALHCTVVRRVAGGKLVQLYSLRQRKFLLLPSVIVTTSKDICRSRTAHTPTTQSHTHPPTHTRRLPMRQRLGNPSLFNIARINYIVVFSHSACGRFACVRTRPNLSPAGVHNQSFGEFEYNDFQRVRTGRPSVRVL